MKFKNFLLKESSNETLIVVDIQPEYQNGFTFDIEEFTEFLNENVLKYKDVYLLYNGADTLGMISEQEYFLWLIENGLEEETLDDIIFLDKGYAFFRACMDTGVTDCLAELISWMYKNKITDSRDIDDEHWDKINQKYGKDYCEEIRDFLSGGDMVNIPDLMDELVNINNKIVITGGAEGECLEEVTIALDALDKKYSKFRDFIY